MPITEAQRIERRKGLGSSDIPCLFGLGFKSVSQLYLEKIGVLPDDDQAGEAAEMGTRLQDAVLDWAIEQLAVVRHERDVPMVGEEPWMRANIDAIAILPENRRVVIEAKTAGLMGGTISEQWGEEDTDEVPDAHLMQMHWQMNISKTGEGYLPVLLGLKGKLQFRKYHIERCDELTKTIVARAKEFWRCVETRTEPKDFRIEPGFAARLPRVDGKIAQVPSDIAQQFIDAKAKMAEIEAQSKDQKKVVDSFKALVLTHMGDAAIGDCALGRFSIKDVAVKGYTTKDRVDKRFTFKSAKTEE